jgi:ribosomal protein S18 acetylase RimI-like enzyme
VTVLEIRTISGYADLERWVEIRNEAAADVFTAEMTALVRAAEVDHVDLLALEDGEPVGAAFLAGDPGSVESGRPWAEVSVPERHRGRGIGATLFRAVADRAKELGHARLRCAARADDGHSIAFLERRGFTVTRRTRQMSLALASAPAAGSAPRPRVELAWLADRPDAVSGMYAVACQVFPGYSVSAAGYVRSESVWQLYELSSPLVRLDLTAVAFSGDRVVGYSVLQDFPGHPILYHENLVVEPDWRGRGIAEALVRSQIAATRGTSIATLVALPRGDAAARVYARLGYEPRETWLELEGPVS